MNQEAPAEALCLDCGLCCNGVLFADVRLKPGDSLQHLHQLGLRFLNGQKGNEHHRPEIDSKSPFKFRQPCAAYANGCCAIYAERPHHCRAFECLLLKAVKAGTSSHPQARALVRRARQQVDEVRALLRALGETDEALPLAARFRRLNRRVSSRPLPQPNAQTFGRLTLAVHELNLLLSRSFYP